MKQQAETVSRSPAGSAAGPAPRAYVRSVGAGNRLLINEAAAAAAAVAAAAPSAAPGGPQALPPAVPASAPAAVSGDHVDQPSSVLARAAAAVSHGDASQSLNMAAAAVAPAPDDHVNQPSNLLPAAATAAGQLPHAPAARPAPGIHSSLLSNLPEGVLAEVYSHLTPWGQLQLRSSNRQLRDSYDRASAGVVRCVASAPVEPPPGATTSEPRRPWQLLPGVCRMLSARPDARASLHMVLNTAAIHHATITAAAQELCAASQGRISHFKLEVRSRDAANAAAQASPELFKAIAGAGPAMEELEIDLSHMHGEPCKAEGWAAAVQALPATLRKLALLMPHDCVYVNTADVLWSQMLPALCSAEHLKHLTHLSLSIPSGTDMSKLAPLASHLTHLELRKAHPLVTMPALGTLLAACSNSLVELGVEFHAGDKDVSLAKILQHTPHLHTLSLLGGEQSHGATAATPSAQDHAAFWALTTLTTLRSNNSKYVSKLFSVGFAPHPSLKRIRHLHLGDSIKLSDWSDLGLLGRGGLALVGKRTFDQGVGFCLGRQTRDAWLLTEYTRSKISAGLQQLPFSTQLPGLPDLERVCDVRVLAPLRLTSREVGPQMQAAAAAVMSELRGLVLNNRPGAAQCNVLVHQLQAESLAIAKAAAAAAATGQAGVAAAGGIDAAAAAGGVDGAAAAPGPAANDEPEPWLLPAMAGLTTLVIPLTSACEPQVDVLRSLPAVLSAGCLPQLTTLILDGRPGDCKDSLTAAHGAVASLQHTAQALSAVGRLLVSHPHVRVTWWGLRPFSDPSRLRRFIPKDLDPEAVQALLGNVLC